MHKSTVWKEKVNRTVLQSFGGDQCRAAQLCGRKWDRLLHHSAAFESLSPVCSITPHVHPVSVSLPQGGSGMCGGQVLLTLRWYFRRKWTVNSDWGLCFTKRLLCWLLHYDKQNTVLEKPANKILPLRIYIIYTQIKVMYHLMKYLHFYKPAGLDYLCIYLTGTNKHSCELLLQLST